MKETIIIASNAVNAKLHNPSTDAKLAVQEILSYMVAGAEQTIAFKQHRWDGKSSFFDYKTASFPAGFVHFVSASLKRRGFDISLARKPLPEPLGPAIASLSLAR